MRKIWFGLVLIFCLSSFSFSQAIPAVSRSFTFQSATTSTPINNTGQNYGFLKAKWEVNGSGPATLSACTFTVQGSSDGVNFQSTIVTAQTCTSDGQTVSTAIGTASSYVRVNVSAYTVSFGTPTLAINLSFWPEIIGATSTNPVNVTGTVVSSACTSATCTETVVQPTFANLNATVNISQVGASANGVIANSSDPVGGAPSVQSLANLAVYDSASSNTPLRLLTSRSQTTAGDSGARTFPAVIEGFNGTTWDMLRTVPVGSTAGALVVTPGATQMAWQGSQVSGIVATTTTRNTFTGLGQFNSCYVLLRTTATGTATGTLQIYIEDSSDGGTTWDDLISSLTIAFGAAVSTQRFTLSGLVVGATITTAASTGLTQGSTTAVETLAAGSARQGPWGDQVRIREKVSGPSGSPVGITYKIDAVCKN